MKVHLNSEYTSFSDPSPGGIGNIAGRGILPVIFDALNDITNTSTPTKFYGVGISYKPFISLFNITGIAEEQPDVAGVVNYAAALAFELRRDTASQRYSLSISFKNGTDDADFRQMDMAGGQSSVFLDDFEKNLGVSCLTCLSNPRQPNR
jgi:prostatic aicd phosphatase